MRSSVRLVLAAAFFCGALLGTASAETLTFERGVDYFTGHLRSGTPNGFEVNGNNLYMGGGASPASGITRAVLSFDIGEIPADAVISSVSLTLTQTAGGAGAEQITVDLMGMNSDYVYSSAAATWNATNGEFGSTPLTSTETTRGNGEKITLTSTEAFVQFVQDSLVSGQLNLLVKLPDAIETLTGDDRTLLQFGSRSRGALAPVLVITYTPAVPEPATASSGVYGNCCSCDLHRAPPQALLGAGLAPQMAPIRPRAVGMSVLKI